MSMSLGKGGTQGLESWLAGFVLGGRTGHSLDLCLQEGLQDDLSQCSPPREGVFGDHLCGRGRACLCGSLLCPPPTPAPTSGTLVLQPILPRMPGLELSVLLLSISQVRNPSSSSLRVQ